jgi:hypothetical protein
VLGRKVRGRFSREYCFDAVRFSPVGGTSQPLIHWINPPTYQRVNAIHRRLPR